MDQLIKSSWYIDKKLDGFIKTFIFFIYNRWVQFRSIRRIMSWGMGPYSYEKKSNNKIRKQVEYKETKKWDHDCETLKFKNFR